MNVRIVTVLIAAIMGAMLSTGMAGGQQNAPKCSVHAAGSPTRDRSATQPLCGIEMTCTDRPIKLNYSDRVCFRATCPGIWAVIHRRADQASFKRRLFTYRHYQFVGTWEVRDQGTLEAFDVPLRELFLVLPGDVIEFRLVEPDCHTRVELSNIGYVKKGSLCEVQQWLAYNTYLERPNLSPPNSRGAGRPCEERQASRVGSNDSCVEGIASALCRFLRSSPALPFR